MNVNTLETKKDKDIKLYKRLFFNFYYNGIRNGIRHSIYFVHEEKMCPGWKWLMVVNILFWTIYIKFKKKGVL